MTKHEFMIENQEHTVFANFCNILHPLSNLIQSNLTVSYRILPYPSPAKLIHMTRCSKNVGCAVPCCAVP